MGLAPNLKQLGVPPQEAGLVNAMYYCAQYGLTLCLRSDDGGLTWGPPVPTNAANGCMGLVGHIAVDSIGTVYIPDRDCNGHAAVERSTDNGLDWTVSAMPRSASRGFAEPDPNVAVGADDTVFVAYRNESNPNDVGTSLGTPMVGISRNHGQTFTAVSPDPTGTIVNTVFPMMVAGDAGRAAMAFYGSTTQGDYQSASYPGVWHLYISFTYDGGKTWTLVDATPTDPVQVGCVWMQGGGNACRNLLDFQGATLDDQGRVVVGYADGCTPGHCSGSSRASLGTIARQTTGKTLLKAFDS